MYFRKKVISLLVRSHLLQMNWKPVNNQPNTLAVHIEQRQSCRWKWPHQHPSGHPSPINKYPINKKPIKNHPIKNQQSTNQTTNNKPNNQSTTNNKSNNQSTTNQSTNQQSTNQQSTKNPRNNQPITLAVERATTELSSDVASSTTMRLGERFFAPPSFFLQGVIYKGEKGNAAGVTYWLLVLTGANDLVISYFTTPTPGWIKATLLTSTLSQ